MRASLVVRALLTGMFVAVVAARADFDWKRQTRAEVQELVDNTALGAEMRAFWLLESWEKGERGLPK